MAASSRCRPQGKSLGDAAATGLVPHVYTVTPGIPGDSGGLRRPRAAHSAPSRRCGLAPLPASNSVGDLAKELAYAQANGMSGLTLAQGTEPFAPIL